MHAQETTRRRFLVAAIACSTVIATGLGAGALRAGSAWAQARDGVTDEVAAMLARLARLLYPHAAIADSVYAEVMADILAATADDPALAATLSTAQDVLDRAQAGDWFELAADRQLAALRAAEAEDFFAAVQVAVRDRFYTHAAVWEHIGYPGSSVEHGGYVERGFDDIDWLPEEA